MYKCVSLTVWFLTKYLNFGFGWLKSSDNGLAKTTLYFFAYRTSWIVLRRIIIFSLYLYKLLIYFSWTTATVYLTDRNQMHSILCVFCLLVQKQNIISDVDYSWYYFCRDGFMYIIVDSNESAIRKIIYRKTEQ